LTPFIIPAPFDNIESIRFGMGISFVSKECIAHAAAACAGARLPSGTSISDRDRGAVERALLDRVRPITALPQGGPFQGAIMNEISAVRSDASAERADATGLIRGLGWLGVAIGVGELAMPRLLASAIGVDPDGAAPAILRAIGVREIATSAAVLARPDLPAPRWTRVIGDVIDLGLLGLALTTPGTAKRRLAVALGMVAGVTALDVLAARRRGQVRQPLPVIASVTINKPPLEVYEFYRRFEQLPLFMDYLVSVEQHGNRRSTWTARLPVGGTVRWEAEILEDRPGEALSWRSIEGSRLQTRGRVTFTRAPGRDMTEVRVELQLGVLGRGPSLALARLFARPQVRGDLRRLKQVMETGEVLRSDASLHRLPYPAQPAPARREFPPPRVFVDSPPTAAKGVSP
jgi:uncharacterized membrane protein